jgi:hypothetical protein
LNVVHYIVIEPKIIRVFQYIEERLSIKLDVGIVKRMLDEAADINVEEKQYTFFVGQGSFLNKALHVSGSIEMHEPQTLLLIIENIRDKDAAALEEFLKSIYPIER